MKVMRIGVELGDNELVEIPATPYDRLKALQHLVDGWIEPCAPLELKDQGIELLANEEGLLIGLEPNENLYPFFLVGQLVAVGVYAEDFGSLSDDQVAYLTRWLSALH